MSMFRSVSLSCAKCGSTIPFQAVHSVNGDRRPDLRAAIINGTFQRQPCPGCAAPLRLEPEFVYLDLGRRDWVLVRPADRLTEWAELEKGAHDIFDMAYGPEAPRPARRIGESLRVRVTFGWAAVQEKLLCSELGLDDLILELVKLAVLRTQRTLPLGDDTECRLIGRTEESLLFAWIHAATEETAEMMEVSRGVYDGIATDLRSWQALHAELDGNPFVDIHRLLVDPTTPGCEMSLSG
ncbi:MAG TPA: CpXC domain-containing protein [Pirellulales bacterium]|nr:CpXC domain-containing protein [Pirellulales bacterium]